MAGFTGKEGMIRHSAMEMDTWLVMRKRIESGIGTVGRVVNDFGDKAF
jgi:hypothetical protein